MTPDEPITVLLADDHALVRRGFRRMLEDDPALRVVGEANDGEEGVRLARELARPVVIHTREADEDTVAILRDEGQGDVRGVLHCFTGTPALARAGLELGLHVSVAGILSFPRASELRETVQGVPLARLLVETDSPYLAPVPFRGKRNEPAHVVRVAEVLATVHGRSLVEVDAQTSATFMALFAP